MYSNEEMDNLLEGNAGNYQYEPLDIYICDNCGSPHELCNCGLYDYDPDDYFHYELEDEDVCKSSTIISPFEMNYGMQPPIIDNEEYEISEGIFVTGKVFKELYNESH